MTARELIAALHQVHADDLDVPVRLCDRYEVLGDVSAWRVALVFDGQVLVADAGRPNAAEHAAIDERCHPSEIERVLVLWDGGAS